MNLHLRVLNGTLKKQDGAQLGSDIAVRGQRFIIGSGSECHMRCPSSAISELHCELVSEANGVFLRDLQSETGTYLNGERLTGKRPVTHGDHLRVGKLEFEVVIPKPAPQAAAAPAQPRPADSMGDDISEFLSAADEEERARSKHDPSSREFKPAIEPKASAKDEIKEEKKKLVRPAKRPPGKLPPPPKIVADNTVNAAEEVLKKFFEKNPKK